MRIPRLYIDQPLSVGQNIRIQGEMANYLGRALRLRPDNLICFFNGSDQEYTAKILDISRKYVEIIIESSIDGATPSLLNLHLLQGLSKGDRMDFVMQKATELGIHKISPVMTEFCNVRLDAKRSEKKQQHWQAIIQAAAEQSGRCELPELATLSAFEHSIEDLINKEVIYLQPQAQQSLSAFVPKTSEVTLVIGPEGGFGEKDMELLSFIGAQEYSLGPRILRTETAAITAISILQSCHGDL